MEFYAKIAPSHKGMFRVCVSVWRTDDKIDTMVQARKFISYRKARRWASKRLFAHMLDTQRTFFIRENDIARREYK